MKILCTLPLLMLLFCSLLGCDKKEGVSQSSQPKKIRIGYIVRDGTAEWFRNELKFAKALGDKEGFDVVEVSAVDGGALMNALDTLVASGCKATVLCPPDVKLGSAIVAAAREKNIKLVNVDDCLLDNNDKPIVGVPYMGISAYDIGKKVGHALWTEAQKRGWKAEETGALILTYEQLATAQDRVVGAMDALKADAFPTEHLYAVAQPDTTLSAAYNSAEPVLAQHNNYKHWLIIGINDDAVLGGVRRLEKDLKPADIIGIGINGDKAAIDEFKKTEMTGFFGTIQLEAKKHGEETARMAYLWVKENKQPPAQTLTQGTLMTRENYQVVRKEQGLE